MQVSSLFLTTSNPPMPSPSASSLLHLHHIDHGVAGANGLYQLKYSEKSRLIIAANNT